MLSPDLVVLPALWSRWSRDRFPHTLLVNWEQGRRHNVKQYRLVKTTVYRSSFTKHRLYCDKSLCVFAFEFELNDKHDICRYEYSCQCTDPFDICRYVSNET